MATVSPTITAENPHVYREQIERIEGFADTVHIDLMDGEFTTNTSVSPSQVWWPDTLKASVHLMYKDPARAIQALLPQKPFCIFVAASTTGIKHEQLAKACHEAGVQFGVVLYQDDTVDVIKSYIDSLDAVLVFSGNLGYQGGSMADVALLPKIEEVKALQPGVRIEWDGGVNEENIGQLTQAGIDVCNVGGSIHFADDPAAAYQRLVSLAQ
ncbi:hypothetical protein KC973_04175 [Candidatus Saccharibacteria bacterium]|nr:hypothetical protein [Candidatus Saccharibacteria bacterium]